MDGQYFLDLLMKIVEGILVASAPLVVGLIAVWIRAKTLELKALAGESLSNNQRWLLMHASEIAVNAAEQMKLTELIGNKKDYAMNIAQEYLEEHGISLNLLVIEAAIEAAVLDLNGKASE